MKATTIDIVKKRHQKQSPLHGQFPPGDIARLTEALAKLLPLRGKQVISGEAKLAPYTIEEGQVIACWFDNGESPIKLGKLYRILLVEM